MSASSYYPRVNLFGDTANPANNFNNPAIYNYNNKEENGSLFKNKRKKDRKQKTLYPRIT